jgi:hypothetical protein
MYKFLSFIDFAANYCTFTSIVDRDYQFDKRRVLYSNKLYCFHVIKLRKYEMV